MSKTKFAPDLLKLQVYEYCVIKQSIDQYYQTTNSGVLNLSEIPQGLANSCRDQQPQTFHRLFYELTIRFKPRNLKTELHTKIKIKIDDPWMPEQNDPQKRADKVQETLFTGVNFLIHLWLPLTQCPQCASRTLLLVYFYSFYCTPLLRSVKSIFDHRNQNK